MKYQRSYTLCILAYLTNFSYSDSCSKSRFSCKVTKTHFQCVPNSFKCDSILDCVDGSDELNCITHTSTITSHTTTITSLTPKLPLCPKGSLTYFYCRDNSLCIPDKYRCNGVADCADGSDEFKCETTATTIHSLCNPHMKGVCIDTNLYNCIDAITLSGQCPGSSTIRCCPEPGYKSIKPTFKPFKTKTKTKTVTKPSIINTETETNTETSSITNTKTVTKPSNINNQPNITSSTN